MASPHVDDGRIATLRQLGLSEPILRLSAGEDVHPGQECGRPPEEFDAAPSFALHARRKYYQCHRQLPAIEEPSLPADILWFIPMFTWRGGMVGVWNREGRLEFVCYCIDCPEDGFDVLARTEQGPLAYVLVGVLNEDLPAAAQAVGFQFLDLWLAALSRGELPAEEGFKRVLARIEAESMPLPRMAP
jgi:hypothetical protein